MDATSGLAIAFGLGIVHAFDADHVTAVSVLATRGDGAGAGMRAGLRWSVGHGVALLLAGTGVLALGHVLPDAWSRIAERAVGLAMIGLGVYVAREVVRPRGHLHLHAHDGLLPHAHWHAHWHGHVESHAPPVTRPRHGHDHGALFVGALHGLAGVAPVLVWLPMAQVSLAMAATALVLFGAGVALAMAIVSGFVGHVAGRLAVGSPRAASETGLRGLRGVGAVCSMGVGAWLFLGAA